MKRILNKLRLMLVLLLPFALAACSDDNGGAKTVSFAKPAVIMPSAYDPAEVTAYLIEPATDRIEVPITISGTAVYGEDYTLSSEAFVFEPGETEATIIVAPKDNIYSSRQARLEFESFPAGYTVGHNSFCIVIIPSQNVYICSFKSTSYELMEETAVTMDIFNGTKAVYAPLFDIKVPFTIDASSTAVLGEHFEIVGDEQYVVMGAGTNIASVTLRYLKYEAGKDKIALRIAEDNRLFEPGTNNRATITIKTLALADMVGTWKYSSMANYAWLKDNAALSAEEKEEFEVVSNADDAIEITTDGSGNYALSVAGITGDLKNYLMDASLIYVGIEQEKLYELDEVYGVMHPVMITELSQANVNFSPASATIRAAQIGFRMLDNGQTLEMRIYDYEPTEFFVPTYEFLKATAKTEKYPMRGNLSIVFHFNKV